MASNSKLKKHLKHIIDITNNRDTDVEDRLAMLFAVIGILASVLGTIVCILAHTSMISIISIVSFMFLLPIAYGIRIHFNVESKIRIVLMLGISILMPVIWLSAGGLTSGVNVWFVYALFFIALSSSGKQLFRWMTIAMSFQLTAYLIGALNSDLVYELPTLRDKYVSTTGSVLVVSLTIIATTSYLKKIYTEEKESADNKAKELQITNERQKNFTANVSHEIRKPITEIIGLNEMILRSETIEEARNYAKQVDEASQEMLGMINDVLAYSRIQADKLEFVEIQYDLQQIIYECFNSNNEKAEAKGLRMILDVDESIPRYLIGDGVKLKQIVNNVLGNAVKYTNTGFIRFKVAYERTDTGINLKVIIADTGIGISEKSIETLFIAFSIMNEERVKSIKGSGFGLALVKMMLEEMNGSINVKSRKGEGSIFTIELPQRVENYTSISAMAAEEKKKEVHHNEFTAENAIIMLVDDTPMNLHIMEALLKKTKTKIIKAGGGAEALSILESQKVDLILMDYLMPVMTGIEAYDKLKQMDSVNADTPVVLLSSNSYIGLEQEYLNKGFDGYISKPVRYEDLERSLRELLPEEKINNI